MNETPKPRYDLNAVQSVMDDMHKTLMGKGEDYSGGLGEGNTFKIFEEIDGTMGFQNPMRVFAVLLLQKIYRIISILSRGTGYSPNYESFDDTLLDLACYIVLCLAWKRFRRTVSNGESFTVNYNMSLSEENMGRKGSGQFQDQMDQPTRYKGG